MEDREKKSARRSIAAIVLLLIAGSVVARCDKKKETTDSRPRTATPRTRVEHVTNTPPPGIPGSPSAATPTPATTATAPSTAVASSLICPHTGLYKQVGLTQILAPAAGWSNSMSTILPEDAGVPKEHRHRYKFRTEALVKGTHIIFAKNGDLTKTWPISSKENMGRVLSGQYQSGTGKDAMAAYWWFLPCCDIK